MRAAVAALALAALLGGCGGGGSGDGAGSILQATASSVGKIRSAELDMRMSLAPRDGATSGRVGFALAGPVDLGQGGLPVARLRYTQLAGDKQASATLISDGRDGFAKVGGTAYRLPAATVAALRHNAGAVRSGAELPVGRWIQDPRVRGREQVGGVEADHVAGRLDAAAALRDIFAAGRAAGAAVPDLSGSRADDVRKAVDAATVDVWSGVHDHLLRRLRLTVSFHVSPPAALRAQLGNLSGGRFAFDLRLGRVNQPVHVTAPANPRPASALRHP
jgi:hypothetical protein